MNILLNTHSPYFLRAIEVFSKKYSVDHKCKYYLATVENSMSTITDVENNTNIIYEKLAKVFQTLEDISWDNGD